jgi:hypothetical protein
MKFHPLFFDRYLAVVLLPLMGGTPHLAASISAVGCVQCLRVSLIGFVFVVSELVT